MFQLTEEVYFEFLKLTECYEKIPRKHWFHNTMGLYMKNTFFFHFSQTDQILSIFFFLFANLELSSRKFLYFSINQTCPFFFSWENFYKIYIQNSFVRNMLMIFFLLFFHKQNSPHLKQRLEIYIETLPPFYHYVD